MAILCTYWHQLHWCICFLWMKCKNASTGERLMERHRKSINIKEFSALSRGALTIFNADPSERFRWSGEQWCHGEYVTCYEWTFCIHIAEYGGGHWDDQTLLSVTMRVVHEVPLLPISMAKLDEFIVGTKQFLNSVLLVGDWYLCGEFTSRDNKTTRTRAMLWYHDIALYCRR